MRQACPLWLFGATSSISRSFGVHAKVRWRPIAPEWQVAGLDLPNLRFVHFCDMWRGEDAGIPRRALAHQLLCHVFG